MRVKETLDKGEYQDLWVQQNGHILQSYQWGEIRSSLGTWEPRRLVLDDRLVVSINVRKLPFKGRIGYIPRLSIPPAVDWRGYLESIHNFAKNHLLLDLLLIDPAWHMDQYKLPDWVKLGQQIQPPHTNWVWLKAKTPEQLWGELKSSYRRNIKKAAKHGLEIEIISEVDSRTAVKDFYTVMQQVAINTDFILVNEEYFQRMWRLLALDKLARIYLAKSGNELVGAYLVTFDEVGAYEFYGGVTTAGRDIEAGYALKWEAIKDAAMLGKDYYDHWGSAPKKGESYDPKHPLSRIAEFKAGFGGEDIEFEHQLVLAFNGWIYYYYQALTVGKRLFLALRKRLKR